MKKTLLFLTTVLLFSCHTNDDEISETQVLLPVARVIVPTDFAVDSVTEIPVKFIRPTTCNTFDGFYYQRENFDRIVAVYSTKLEQSNCITPLDSSTQSINFKPKDTGVYHFKFWKGKDASGANIFETHDFHVAH